MDGFIKIHRQFIEWEWYHDINCSRLFLHCLFRANFKDQKFEGKIIPKGSFVTSYENLAQETDLSIRNIRTCLNKLKSTGELTHKTTSRYSIITVNNWNKWQSKRQTNRQASDKQVTTIEERKKERSISNNTHTNIKNSVCDFLNISDEEVSILKQYAKKSKANNVDAYVHSLIKSGGYKEILEKHKKVKSIVKEILPPKPVEISDEERSKVIAMIQEKKQELRKIIRGS